MKASSAVAISFDAQKKQAEAMTNVATQNLVLKIAAVKEKKRKAAEALAERQNKKISNSFLEFDLDS